MNAADRDMLTALVDTAASCLDVPRPLVAAHPVGSPEEFDAWFTAYKENAAAYNRLVETRAVIGEVALRNLARGQFDEISIRSVTEGLAEELARPLPYPVAPETQS